MKQSLISETIDLVEPTEFDRRKLTHVMNRRLEKKPGVSQVVGRQQLDVDFHAILKGQIPRKFGEMPRQMGNYERIAPSEMCDAILRARNSVFSK